MLQQQINSLSTLKYNLLLFFVLILLAAHLSGNAAYAAAEQDVNPGKNFIWSVKGEKNTVYLIGSVHLMKQSSYPLPEAVETTYACCKKIVFETDLDNMDRPEMQTRIMQLARYPQGQTLSQNISQGTYSLLKKRLVAAGLPADHFENFKPWFVAQAITGGELIKLGYDSKSGIDSHFFMKAKNDKKEILFLETNQFQLNLLAGLGRQNQDLFLNGVIKELDTIETMAADMLDAWRSGNTQKLRLIIEKSFEEQPDNYDHLIKQRNKQWAIKIEKFLRQNDDILLVVGSAHLTGKGSVIELLEKKGYRVQQR